MTAPSRLLPERLCPWLALALAAAAAALHLLYLAHDCPLDLAPDEAHYWDWSRRIDWSYYSKGPLVAWLIRLSCELVGPWSVEATGGIAFAVRLPAVVCGSLLLLSLYALTSQATGRPRLALAVVAGALTLPLVNVGATLMTIDAPYTCCWGWALVFAHRAVTGRSGWAWEAAGLMVGLGILAKYTMVLFVPSLALFLLFSREHRKLLLCGGFWSMLAIASLCCLPIVVWNAQNGWVTLRHVAKLAGVGDGDGAPTPWRWHGPLAYAGGQAAVLLGYWFVVWLCAMIARNPLREADTNQRFLWWLSAPMFLVFAAFSVKTGGGELNWPVTAYLSGGVLAAMWLASQLASPQPAHRAWMASYLALACAGGLAVTALAHRSELARPALVSLGGPPSEQRPFPLRRLDPTCRLRGYRALAAAVDRLRDELAARGQEPVVAATHWSLPGELGAYCGGQPTVYSLGRLAGDRHSQYDFWPGPVTEPEAFVGRSFVVVGVMTPRLEQAFAQVERAVQVRHEEGGQPIAAWAVYVCHGYKGPGEVPKAGH